MTADMVNTTGFTQQEVRGAQAMIDYCGIVDEGTPEEIQEFHRHALVMMRCLSLLWSKRGYGQSWRQHGYVGSILKASIKVNRLMNLHWYQEHEEGMESQTTEDSADTFLDLINYGVFGFEQWKDGEERGPNRPM